MVKTLNCCRAAVLLLIAIGPAQAEQPESQIIPLDLSGGYPLARLSVEGHGDAKVIFDTGANQSLLTPEYVAALGLPNLGQDTVTSPGGGPPLMAYKTTLKAATLGEASIADAPIAVIALPPQLSDISGVISPDVFADRLVRYELGSSRAVVVDETSATTPRSKAFAYDGTPDDLLPAAVLEVGGLDIVAHLDTGSPQGIVLPFSYASKLKLKAPPVERGKFGTINGVHARYEATLDGTLTIGPLVLNNPDIAFVDGFPVGNLGMPILKQIVLVLDPKAHRDWMVLPE